MKGLRAPGKPVCNCPSLSSFPGLSPRSHHFAWGQDHVWPQANSFRRCSKIKLSFFDLARFIWMQINSLVPSPYWQTLAPSFPSLQTSQIMLESRERKSRSQISMKSMAGHSFSNLAIQLHKLFCLWRHNTQWQKETNQMKETTANNNMEK